MIYFFLGSPGKDQEWVRLLEISPLNSFDTLFFLGIDYIWALVSLQVASVSYQL